VKNRIYKQAPGAAKPMLDKRFKHFRRLFGVVFER